MARKIKQEYYRLDDLLSIEANYYILLGERSNGKSYAVKEHILERAYKERKKFMLLRRYSDDIKNPLVNAYFSDMIEYIIKMTKGTFNNIFCKNGKIFMEYIDEDGEQQNVIDIGYVRSLSQAERLKSNSYLDVDEIVFEEFIATGCYLPMEINLFESIISTVARRRRIKVFMIGNTISRNCIYFQHFSLLNVPKQEQGTIDIYEMPTDPPQYNDDGTEVVVRIAVELCENKTANTKMFAGNSQKAISNGAWTSEVQPKIKFKDSFEELYRVVFKFRMAMFLGRFYVDNENGDMFWVVEPKVKPIRDGTRVISDEINPSALYTSNLTPLFTQEKIMFDYIKRDKVFYSDNLTGTEFKEAIKYFINNKIGYR